MGDKKHSETKADPTRWVKRVLIVATVVVVAAMGFTVYRFIPLSRQYYTDADTIKVGRADAETRDILWQPPRKLSTIINTGGDDYEPRVSSDGLSLYFVRGKAGENADIYMSTHTYEGWTEPKPFVEVNSEFEDLGPEPSADGKSLYFYSDRPGGLGGYDLWVTHRMATGWSEPINLGPDANSAFNDYGPALTPDGTRLYFSSNRPQPGDTDEPNSDAWPATIREDLYQRDYDLYAAVVGDAGVRSTKPLTALNSPYNEGAPAVSSFGDYLYFASDRPGGFGGFDLYRSRRLRGAQTEPRNLGGAVNGFGNELDPGLTMGGYALYFSSDRPPGADAYSRRAETESAIARPSSDSTVNRGPIDERVAEDAAGSPAPRYDLYYTTSREVFAESERIDRSPIDWAAFWRDVGPNLLWALLALLLLLMLLSLLRGARGRRLSLLAKCLLTSITAHLLLMLLFNVWEVTASLAREIRRHGPIQIALASPVMGDEIAGQIRGRMTEIEPIELVPLSSQPRVAPAEPPIKSASVTLDMDGPTIEFAEHIPVQRGIEEATPFDAIQLAESRPIVPAPLNPSSLDARPPELARRINTHESKDIESVSTPQLQRVERPESTIESQSATGSEEVMTALPRTSATEGASDDARTMAIALRDEVHDAQPELKASLPVDRALDVRTDAPRVDVKLPDAVRNRASVIEETLPAPVPARLRVVGRRSVVADAADRAPTPSLHELAPARSAALHDESTFAPRPEVRDTAAAVPGESASDSALSAANRIVSSETNETELPFGELALDALESATSLDGPEASVDPVHVVAQPVQRAPAHVATGAPQQPRNVALEPRPSDQPSDEVSFVSEDTRRVREAFPNGGEIDPTNDAEAVAVHAMSILDPTPPSLSEMAIPTDSRTSSNAAEELDKRLIPQPTELSRSAARHQITDDVQPAPDQLVVETPVGRSLFERTQPDQFAAARPDGAVDAVVLPSTERLALATPRIAEMLLQPDAISLDLTVPQEQVPPSDPYAQRLAPDRLSIVMRLGGSEETERAVAAALRWLANHQSDDGHWDGDGFDESCDYCGGETDVAVDHALTGLSLLAFLGAGHTSDSDGPYRERVVSAQRWLLNQQGSDGDFRGNETMYSHAIATIAISEAFGMTGDDDLREPIRQAVVFIDRARNRREGGWRYDPGEPGDTSVLGWQVMALKSASMNGIPVQAESFQAARDWLDRVSDRRHPGLYAYQPGSGYTPPMTAEAMFAQQLLGVPRNDPRMEESAKYIAQYQPDWERDPNTYYWYYATLALFQHGGEYWPEWNRRLTKELLDNQRSDNAAAGSWDPVGEWADVGGRVYQTALCTLMLEVYYRYLPLYSADKPGMTTGVIRGLVTDGATGRPLAGAEVRLVLPGRSPMVATASGDGSYELAPPEVPDFFALSASREGYVPSSVNVAAAMVRGSGLALDFALRPVGSDIVAIEPVPDVHHLGDNQFDGTINSQFQKESEGAEFSADFDLRSDQVSPHISHAEVRLLAKGVQRSHRILINGTTLDDRLDDAPEDGSFGEFVAEFDPELLRPRTNTFQIIAKPSSSDIDDFEFVNVQIQLRP